MKLLNKDKPKTQKKADKKPAKEKMQLTKKVRDIFTKVFHVGLSRHVQEEPEPKARVTKNDIETYRKEIIERGKKHLKPSSVPHHKVVLSSIVIGVIVLILIIFGYGYLVYRKSSNSSVIYNTSKIINTPVAVVDEQKVGFDEVLFQYRTAQRAQERLGFEESKTQDQLFMEALLRAAQNRLILHMANEQNIKVSEEDIDKEIENSGNVVGGTEVVESGAQEIFGWSDRELREQTKIRLLYNQLAPSVALGIIEHYQEQGSIEDYRQRQGEANASYAMGDIADITQLPKDTPKILVEQVQSMEANSISPQAVRGEDGHFVVIRYNEESEIDATYFFFPQSEVEREISGHLEGDSFYTCLATVDKESVQRKGVWSCINP